MLMICYSQVLAQFITLMHTEFAMKDLGPIHHFLGIEITHTSAGLHLSQSHYALTILEKIDMVDCKPISTPLEAKTKGLDNNTLLDDPNHYRGIVGAYNISLSLALIFPLVLILSLNLCMLLLIRILKWFEGFYIMSKVLLILVLILLLILHLIYVLFLIQIG